MGVGYSVRFLEGWAPVMGSGHSVEDIVSLQRLK